MSSSLSAISDFVGCPVSRAMLIKFLKTLGYTYRRIRKSLKNAPDPLVYEQKVQEMMQLIALERKNYLKIYYADEASFSETPCVPYGWQPKGEPFSIPTTRGRRWNVFGIMSNNNELFSYKTTDSINSDFIIKSIDDFAQNPKLFPRTVIILDNAKVHSSALFKRKIAEWKEQGIEIFYLPTYSPHLNRIETLWRKIKYEWLLPQDFVSWDNMTSKLEDILSNLETKYTIKFEPY